MKISTTKTLLLIASIATLSSCSNKMYHYNLIEKNPIISEFSQQPSEYKIISTTTEIAVAEKQTSVDENKNKSVVNPKTIIAKRKKSETRFGLFHPVNNLLAAKAIAKQVKALKSHTSITSVEKTRTDSKIKQGIMLIVAGLVVCILGAILGVAGLGPIASIIYLIGGILILVGIVIILIDVLEG